MKKLARLSLIIAFLGLFYFTLQAIPAKAETSLSYNSQLASLWETFSQINKLFEQLKALIAKNPRISSQSQLAAIIASTDAAATLNNLKPGEWISIPNSKLNTVLPNPLPQLGYGGPGSIIDAWNGAAYDSKRDQLIIAAAGGHADYSGNEVYAFSMSALTWQRLTNPSPTTKFQVDPSKGVNPDGTPVSRHTYDGIEYLPDQDVVWLSGGSRWYDGSGTGEGWWLRLDTSPPQWVRKNNGPTGWLGVQAVWDPISKKLYERGYNTYFSYDPVTDMYTSITSQDAGTGSDTMMVVDPERRKIYRIGAALTKLGTSGYGKIFVLDLATNIETTQVTMGATEVEFQDNGPGLAWDPVAKVVVAYGKTANGLNGRIYTLDPATWVWTAWDTAGAILPPLPHENGVWSRFWYSPAYDEFFVVTLIYDNVYAYRPAWRSPTSTPPIDTTPPSTPTNLTATAFSSTQINLSWTASTDNVGVTGYRIYRGGTQIATTAATSYQNTGLAANTTYSYTVAAYDAAGIVSGQSVSRSATTQTVAVPPPVDGQINLPLGQWVALPSPTPFIGGTKHVSGAWNSDNGRMYFTGGDYGDFSYGSYQQQTWSLSLTERWADKMNSNAGLRLEYDNCGPVGRSRDPGEVQPKHPDFVGWVWDSARHLFWFVPGEMVAASGNCAGETPQNVGDPGFPFYRVMTFNPVSGRWADIAPAEIGGGDQWGAVYDPVTDTIIRFSGYSATKVGTFNIAQGTWSYKAFSSPSFIDGGKPAFDPKARVIYTINPYDGILYQYNIGTQTFDNLGPIPGGPITDCWKQPMIVWNSADNVLLLFRYKNYPPDPSDPTDLSCVGNFPNGDFQAYHPDTKKWEQLSLSTDIAGLIAEGLVMDYDPGQNVVTLISRSESGTPYIGHMFLYRYGAGSVPPPPPPPADTTSPTVSLTAPTSGATVSGSAVTVSANASDNVGVAGVQFKLDESNLGVEDAVSPYSVSWNTTLSSNGSHTLTATARDAAGNMGTASSLTLTVNNPVSQPPPSPPPLTCAPVTQTVVVNTQAAFSVSGGGTGASYEWRAPLGNPSVGSGAFLANSYTTAGTYIVTVSLAGSSQSTATCSVVVTVTSNHVTDTELPTIPQGLNGSALSSSQTTLSWNASTDNIGVTGYKIYRNGSAIATSPSLTYTDVNLSPSTSYRYTVAAYDLDGNTSSQSGSVSLTTLAGTSPPPALSPPPSASAGFASPSILSVSVNEITARSATVVVTTDIPAIDQIEYGKNINYGNSTAATPTLAITYNKLARLEPGTTYNLRATAYALGRTARSDNYTFTTLASGVGGAGTPSGGVVQPPTLTTFFTQDLRLGSRGKEVSKLQAVLQSLNYFPKNQEITSYFGTVTQRALRIFQANHNVGTNRGSFDAPTRELLNKVVFNNPTLLGAQTAVSTSTQPIPPTAAVFTKFLYRGLEDPQVALLQQALIKDGDYPEAIISGFYGSLTEKAVQRFQAKYGIVSQGTPYSTGYGAVGPRTRAKLNEIIQTQRGALPAGTPSPQELQQQLRQLQQLLQQLKQKAGQ